VAEALGAMDVPSVVVAGGGWAGLAAAVELTARGIPVTLCESSRQLGGRARSVPFGRHGVDNGQHLLIGAYGETLRLLETLGITESDVLLRRPLRLELAGRRSITLSAPRLPAPLHLVAALLKADGLTAAERLRALSMTTRLFMRRFELPEDMTVAELLERYKQPSMLREMLWEPLSLATLNTPAERASARHFLRVLRDGLVRDTRGSDLLFTRRDLGNLLPGPAMDYIERHGGHIRLNSRVTGLELDGGKVAAVTVGSERIECDHAILALPPQVTARLTVPHDRLASVTRQSEAIDYEPIATVYLRYPAEVELGREMLGLVDGIGQWVFDRRICGQPGVIAVVISGPGEHMSLSRAALADRVGAELAQHFPDWPAPLESLVIREKRATFSCVPGVEDSRPPQRTAVPGCWLAGDHTATPYPATLEGAVLSGVQCARHIVADWEKRFI
jgi:squalene-associated FAD-dependent desaturase